MPTFSEAAGLFRDLAQVLVLDRLNPERNPASKLAGAHCRTVRFHSRCKIRPLAWPELFQKLGVAGVEQITIPGPAVNLGDVGDPGYYFALASLVRALRPKSIFEFGTYLGVSALTLAANTAPDCRIFTLDLPDSAITGDAHQLNDTDEKHVVKSRSRVGEAFRNSPLAGRITQFREDSMTFRAEKHASQVDLVFVDGGHSTPLVTKDTENAFRILADDGAILWDDYFHHYPDVVAFLDELADRYPLHAVPGTNFVLYSRRWHKIREGKSPS
jgi:predicted O-methyltransferase YrrM